MSGAVLPAPGSSADRISRTTCAEVSRSCARRGACSVPARVVQQREVCLSIAVEQIEELPDIDDRLALPEAGYEIIDGVVTFVAPADPPHGERHAVVAALIKTSADASFRVAIDMLTRTSKIDDIAPDVSVFPRAPHPVTGGRQLEELAFEIVSTESMSHATKKAGKLATRGVRRVFAIDIKRNRVVEWSRDLESWNVLDVRGQLADPALAAPLSVHALLEAANTDDDVQRALIAKHNPVFEAAAATLRAEGHTEGRAVGRAEIILDQLMVRGVALSLEQRERILCERDLAVLAEWGRRALICSNIDELFATP